MTTTPAFSMVQTANQTVVLCGVCKKEYGLIQVCGKPLLITAGDGHVSTCPMCGAENEH